MQGGAAVLGLAPEESSAAVARCYIQEARRLAGQMPQAGESAQPRATRFRTAGFGGRPGRGGTACA
jgi:hypothetical protein